MPRPAWLVVTILALVHVALARGVAARAGGAPVTYVFTPLVDVVPGGVPVSAGEAAALAAEAKNRVDARDIQQAYARLGSTISLDDLLRGVEEIEAGATPLDAAQRAKVHEVLRRAQADHAAVSAVQAEILDLEADLAVQVEGILAALPPETRARVEARARADAPAKGAGPRPPGAPGGLGAPTQPSAPGGPGAPTQPSAPGGPGAPPAPGSPGAAPPAAPAAPGAPGAPAAPGAAPGAPR
jgi:hypothetical protein